MVDHMAVAAEVLPPDLLLAWTLAVAEERHLEVLGVVANISRLRVSALDNAIGDVLSRSKRTATYIVAFSDALLRRLNEKEVEHERS